MRPSLLSEQREAQLPASALPELEVTWTEQVLAFVAKPLVEAWSNKKKSGVENRMCRT